MWETLKEIGLISLLITLAFFWGFCSRKNESTFITKWKRDTIVIVKPAPPIILERIKPKIIYRRDTIVQTQPFVAQLDTIIQHDTIYLRYTFPENYIDLRLLPKPDSIRIHTITITRDRPWWELPATAIGGLLVGFIMGKSGK